MKKPIKMVGFDLDGTILTDSKELTANTREVLVKALNQGVVVLPATGRPLTGIPREILEIPGLRYALTANGARIVDIKEDNVIYESLLSVEMVERILDIFEKYDTLREVYYDGTGYTSIGMIHKVEEYLGKSPMAKYILKTRVPVENLRTLVNESDKAMDKVQAIFKNKEEQAKAFKELADIRDIEVTSTMHNNIEVNRGGVDKGSGMLMLGKLLGIQKEEIMAVGDGMNDLQMVGKVGLGVAMHNAAIEVKEAAGYITDSNEQEGVAKAILKFVLA